jgi:nicotinamide mononucleotide adenylyltransferase
MMQDGEYWSALVPESVASTIASIKGVERLMNICRSDASHS